MLKFLQTTLILKSYFKEFISTKTETVYSVLVFDFKEVGFIQEDEAEAINVCDSKMNVLISYTTSWKQSQTFRNYI